MIGEEFTESAKAVQEVAKTTKAGIEATEKLGGFVSRIIGEPIDEVVGILKDKLKFVRWERQIRLTKRANEIIGERMIEGDLRIVPPKVALPIIENASLEENDELQDLWAHLIASAVDPNFNGTVRTAFVDIIKQLEVTDVHILNFIYGEYSHFNVGHKAHMRTRSGSRVKITDADGTEHPVLMKSIIRTLGIDEGIYKESIDNLIRVRCVASFIKKATVNVPRGSGSDFTRIGGDSLFNRGFNTERINFNVTHIYDKVCITSLGLSFAKACMKSQIEETK